MKKPILLVGIGLLLVVVVGGYLMTSGRLPMMTPGREFKKVISDEIKRTSMKGLLAMGIPQQCTYNDSQGNGGTVFVGNNKMRGDFVSKDEEDKEVKSHMITVDQTSYIWMDEEKQGFKMAWDINKVDGEDEVLPTPQPGQIDANQEVDYKCQPWILNNSVYEVPKDVTFSDFSKMLAPTGQAGGIDVKTAQCAACDSAPEESRAQCKAALGCN